MSSPITFRIAEKKDIAPFISFFRESIPVLFPEYSPKTVERIINTDYSPLVFAEKIQNNQYKVYIALNDDKIVGYLTNGETFGGVSYAEWLGVDKQYQKRGIASQLLSLLEKDVMKKGAHAFYLWTSKEVVSFYIKCGFKNGGLFPSAWYGCDSYLMYKHLREPEEKNYLKEYLSKKK